MFEGDNPRGERKALQRRFPLFPWVFSQISHSSGATRGAGALLLQCSDVHPTFLTPFLFCHNGVLAIKYTNDCVSNPVISVTLTLCLTQGTVQISLDSAFFGNFGDNAVALIHSRNY